MHCPNVNSPEWKSLVEKVGETNAWREFFKYGEIPTTEETVNETVLRSIKTKTTKQIAQGINRDLIRDQQEIKYTNFIQSLVINKLGDISPNKKLTMSPDEAFNSAKGNFEQAIKNVNDFVAIVKTPENFDALKAKDEKRLGDLLAKFYLQNVSSFEEAAQARENYQRIVDNFEKYKGYVTAELAHKGIKIKKGKFEVVQQDDVENKEQDETEDTSLSNEEVSKERFDRSIFETNPRDTASVRVKALIQTIKTGEYEMGIPLYADADDVFLDILEAGVAMDLSNYTDQNSKLNAFRKELGNRKEARPYLDDLLSKINAYEKAGEWDKINDILTVATKAFANETLVLYTLSKMGTQIKGVKLVKVIASNRDTVEFQVRRDWLARHQVSGFFDKSADGKLTPNAEKVEMLNKIRLEGKNATGDAQKQKFIEYFNVLGIKFTMKDLDYIAPILSKELKKGKNFSLIFNDGKYLLNNIYQSFVKNLEQPFEGQYGFEDEKSDMTVLARLYHEANPGMYKPASSKTADGKSKYLYIQPNYVEIAKREFDKGNTTSVTNTALAKPNISFWTKVKNQVYKFILGYFNGSREQEAGKDGKVRKNFTEKEQVVTMFLKHQENLTDGTYITFTLSDKTTSMEAKMTKEFFVDSANNPVGKGEDYVIKDNGLEYTDKLKDKVYNSFVEPEISRILSAIKNGDKVNLENYSIASKLFYFVPKLNSDPSLENFRKDLYSGKKTEEELKKQYSTIVADVILSEFKLANEEQLKYLIENKIIEKQGNKYSFPLFNQKYVNRFRETGIPNALLPEAMIMDMKLNYMNSQIKTVQFLKFDPAHAFKAFKGFDKSKSFDQLNGEEKIKLVNASWDEFSKRAASLIAPGDQGNWSWKYNNNTKSYSTQEYRAVTLKDVKRNVGKYEGVETTDAQEYVTMQEHIDYLMSRGKMPLSVWESIHAKIVKEGPGGYYELSAKELKYVFAPVKPVYVNSAKEGDTDLNRFDYIKSSRYPLIPQHEIGSERDKLRIWMEKNNIQSANFGSGKKLGRPSVSLEVFDKDNNFIEPKDFDKSIQVLSRDGLRNQQEIPGQKDEISNVSQMNRTLFDGLLDSTFTFSKMSNVDGRILKQLKEAIRARQFQMKAEDLENEIGDVWKSQRGLYNVLRNTILNDTTGSYTENDLKSIELDSDGMFKIPLEVQFKFKKFQGLINSMINNNVKLKVEGSSFVQVSAVGAKFNFSDLSKGTKSDIIWTDKYAKQFKKGEPAELKYIEKKNGEVSPAQVIVSQYLRDSKGELIDLAEFITEKNGVKVLDTSRMSEDMLQLVASRIPNQSHVSMLPIEVVGFLPSYMENTIIVPDGITGQMGSDFDVDKLYAYMSKVVEGKNKKGETTYGPVEYNISSVSDIDKLNADQLQQAYRDLHWNVLTHPDAFDKITKSVDNPEVVAKKELRDEQLKKYGIETSDMSNLPLDFMTSINRFTDNKSGKSGVSIFANLISAQADMQDKVLVLGTRDKKGNPIEKPIYIKLSKKAKNVTDLLYVGQTGSSKSFLYKPNVVPERSVSDNLNIAFTESVDNAKNLNLRYFNWDDKSMGAVGFLAMLTDQKGQAVPIEFMMDLTSQSAIKNLLTRIDLKQDSFGIYDSKAILNSTEEIKKDIISVIDNKKLLKAGETADGYFSDENRNTVLDPETLADMWIVGQANVQVDEQKRNNALENIRKDLNKKYGEEMYKSVNDLLLDYYNTQYNSLDLFLDVQDKARELMTILGAVYPYTKGIGSNMFETKQKINQLNKLADSSNFTNVQDLAGEVEKDKKTGVVSINPKGELGAAIQYSFMVAQDMYRKLFPIASGQKLENIVTKILENQGLSIDQIGKEKYTSTFEKVFYSAIDYLYTTPELELFDNSREARQKLINGEGSLGKRILNLKEKPEFAKNGFLKYLEVKPINNSDAFSIAFKDPFGTEVNEKSVISGFYELATSDDEDIRQISKDIAIYTYATGDAGNIGRFIPIDYYLKDKDYAKAIKKIRGIFVDSMSNDDYMNGLIDQIVQNYSEEFSKKFSYSTSEDPMGDSDSLFKQILKPLLKGANSLENVSTLSFKLGNFLANEKAKGLSDSLQIPLSPSEIQAATEEGINIYKTGKNGETLLNDDGEPVVVKSKYPPYILITDSYEGVDYFSSRTKNYLYKRVSKAVTEDGIARYERINILGAGGIKEFEFDNTNLKSVIKNNDVDSIDKEMLPDDVNMSEGLTPEMFEDYSIKPGTNVKGDIKLNIIEQWVQDGTATTTVRNPSYHKDFYKGDGVYITDKGNLVTISHKGLVKLEGDKVVGNNISYTKDEFAKKEGFGTWENFEKSAKYAGQSLIQGKSVHLYEIAPVKQSTPSQQQGSVKEQQIDNTSKPEFDKLPGKSATPTMTYAGIGSRETPKEVLDVMTKAAEYLDGLGYTLQTGFTFKDKETGEDEEGADKAFSQGSKNKMLFGPSGIRKTVKGNTSLESYNDSVTKVSNEIVKEIHPAPDRLKPGAVKLMARNTNQIFGKNLDSSVDFVLFYAQETDNPLRPKGGTGQAVEMARRKGIPTINIADANWRDQLKAVIKKTSTEEVKEEPIIVTYKDTNYIAEGTIEEGDLNFYYQKDDGSKSELVKDNGLYHKLSVQHEADIHPSSVVELTDLQHSPRYLVSIEGQVYSLTPSNFGKEIESEDVIKRVYSKLNSKLEDKVVLEEKGPEPGGEKPTFSYKGITVPTEFKLSEQQTKALTDIIDFTENPAADTGIYKGTYTLEGYAGTGKTSIIGVLERYTKEKNKHTEFIYMAPTHAATVALGLNVVKYGSRYLPMTVQSAVREGKDKLGNKVVLFTKKFTDRAKGIKNIIVIDEASMLANKDFDKMIIAAEAQGHKIIFMGDPKQIPEVMPGAKTKELAKAFANPSKSVLSTVFRTKDNNILNVLTNIRNNKDFVEYNFESTDKLKQLPRGEYNDELIKDLQNNLEDVTILNYTNDGVAKINQSARKVLGFEGELKAGEKIVGYAGSQSKQIEKGHLANSISYMVDEVKKSEDGPITVTANSKLLKNLRNQGMSGFKESIQFTYLQLSEDDSFDFGLSQRQMDYNKEFLKKYLKEIHNLNEQYLVKKSISYPAYLNLVESIRKDLADINTGAKYIYNPKTDSIEMYDSRKHTGINANLEMDKGVDFGYGITVHKSQGMTIPIVYFDTSSLGAVSDTNITRNGEKFNTEKNALYYVGMSRASEKLVVPITETRSNIEDDAFSPDDNQEKFSLADFFRDSMVDDLTKSILGNPSNPDTPRAIFNKMLNTADSLTKNILLLVSKSGGVGDLKIVVDENQEDPGSYANNVITINPKEAIGNTEDEKVAKRRIEEVIVHELLHHMTANLLRDSNFGKLTSEQRKWVVSLKNLFNNVQTKFLNDPTHKEALQNAIDQSKRSDGYLSEADKTMYYGLTSVDDFVSMLMTDEGFRDLMNNTKFDGQKSILDRFIEILANILKSLGIQVREDSVLKEGLTNIVGLIESKNRGAEPTETGAPLKSISTSKKDMISENFEEILNILNIKSQC